MENQKLKYDVIIMAAKRNLALLFISLPYIRRNLGAEKIVIVTALENQEIVRKLGCEFQDEDKVYTGLTYESIKRLILEGGGNPKSTGWYLQQFLKMSYCYKSRYKNYVVWDSDTIPLSKIEYVDDNGKLIFSAKREYHLPYFDVIQKLFSGAVVRYDKDVSFIAENMIIKCEIMKNIIASIQSNERIRGIYFFERIINCVNQSDLSLSGFSEFETYGNYVMRYHRNEYSITRRKSLRTGVMLVGFHPGQKQLDWLSKDFDVVSIENKARTWKGRLWLSWTSVLFKAGVARKIISARNAARFIEKVRRLQAMLLGNEIIPYNDI